MFYFRINYYEAFMYLKSYILSLHLHFTFTFYTWNLSNFGADVTRKEKKYTECRGRRAAERAPPSRALQVPAMRSQGKNF